jgi:catechol 2,3-dioxygenase-like lactoylglutathione lyase family enzyme
MLVSNATLHHTCFLVNDLEKSVNALVKSISLTFNTWTIKPERCMVKGKYSQFSFRVAMAQIGDASIELISPLSGDSIYNEYLLKNGEGFHHICFAYEDLKSMQSAKSELLNKGYNMIQHAKTDGAFEFGYFSLPGANILLELLYLNGLPEPEKIYS